MNKLPQDFTFSKYGIDVRLAQIEDSEFIFNLRMSKRGSILGKTKNELVAQIEWMKEYKKREAEGTDYYFIYSKNGKPFGVNRLNDLDWENNTCYSGSWVCSEDTPFEDALATCLIIKEIEFDIVHVKYALGFTRHSNKQVQKFSKLLRGEETGRDENFIYYRFDYNSYKYGNDKVKKILGLKD